MTPSLIAITGATGFTGRRVVKALSEAFPGVRLRCLVRDTSPVDAIQLWHPELIEGDLRDPRPVERLLKGADVLVNVASLGFDYTDSIVEGAKRSQVARAVFIGTTAILTKLPVSSKAARERAEHLVAGTGKFWTLLRPTMIYGAPGDRNISRLIRFVMTAPVIPVPAGKALQQPIHVEDVAAAIVGALKSDRTIGRAYNIAGRDPLPLRSLVAEVVQAVGRRRWLVPVPRALLMPFVYALEALSSTPVLTIEQIRRLEEDKHFDYSEASRDFGFSPRSFQQGVLDEVRLMRASGSAAS